MRKWLHGTGMYRALAVPGAAVLLAGASAAHAQRSVPDTSGTHDTRAHVERDVLGSTLALGAAVALDRPMRDALHGPDANPVVHALSQTGNALGTAGHLVPAMAGAYVIALAQRSSANQDAVLDVAAGYAAADIAEGLLKMAVGRERPFVHGAPDRFHPFSNNGDYHSFPSGHMTHIAALATGAALESRSPWVRDVGIGATVLVAWQRVHADEHWTSDVVAGSLLGHFMSAAVVGALDRREGRHRGG